MSKLSINVGGGVSNFIIFRSKNKSFSKKDAKLKLRERVYECGILRKVCSPIDHAGLLKLSKKYSFMYIIYIVYIILYCNII